MTGKNLMLIIFIVVLAGCATGRVSIQSQPPDAEVFVSDGQGAPVSIGKTPLYVDIRTLERNSGEEVQIWVKKEGFHPESVLLPGSMLARDVSLSAKLEESKMPESCSNQVASLQKVASGVARIQVLLNTKRYEQVEPQLLALIAEHPNVSVLYDLLGNLYYLQKDLDRALAAYEQAHKLNPENPETNMMVHRIKSIRGEPRLPASGGY